MNANELTALIGECLRKTDDHNFFLKLESVLRQQQAEIEALKQSKFNDNNKVNNKPLAWMVVDVDSGKSLQFEENKFSEVNIPLYTHPVKELTDEEIRHIQAICHLKDVGYDNFIMRFARAILRKAQENG